TVQSRALHSFPTRRSSDLQWPTLFAEAAITLDVGEISDPLRAGNGFHIIQLKDKRGDATQKVEQYKVRHILITSSAVRSPKQARSEEHTSELQSRFDLVCR